MSLAPKTTGVDVGEELKESGGNQGLPLKGGMDRGRKDEGCIYAGVGKTSQGGFRQRSLETHQAKDVAILYFAHRLFPSCSVFPLTLSVSAMG